jgi:hypothetical protein
LGVSEDYDLSGVGGVSENLLVAGDGGIENDFAGPFRKRTKCPAFEDCTVFQGEDGWIQGWRSSERWVLSIEADARDRIQLILHCSHSGLHLLYWKFSPL